MSRRSVFTTITPLPPGIPRATVMDTLRSHTEMIDLNPLVIERVKCKPPGYAGPEEYHATWYQLKDKIQYLPGGLIQGNVTYNACFHDLPGGLQTHVYAPMGLDIKGKWSLGGSLPEEPAQPVELGLNIPKQGLYLREDVDMRCNIIMSSFVKKTLKKAHSTLVDRLLEKARLVQRDTSNEWINNFHSSRQYTHLSSPMAGSRPASVSCSNLSDTLSTPSTQALAHHRLSATGSMVSVGAHSDDGRFSTYGSPDPRFADPVYQAYNPAGGPHHSAQGQDAFPYQAFQPRPLQGYGSPPPTHAAAVPVELPGELALNVPPPLKHSSRSASGEQQQGAPAELAG